MRGWCVVSVAALALGPAGQTRGASPAASTILRTESASNVFFARATINGAGPFWFTIDTGATLTVIDPAAARRAGLPVRDAGRRSNVGIASADTSMATTAGARIDIPGLPPFSPPTLYVVPVRASAGPLGHAIDGVLGTDVLSGRVVEFDYGGARVRVRPSTGADPPNRKASVVFSLEGNVLIAPGTLTLPDGERVIARLLVDTGSNGALTLTSPFVRRHNLVARFPSRQMNLAIGINGTATSPVVALAALAFGDAVIRAPNAALSQATAGLDASTDFDGIVGAELLKQFTLTIDYPRRRLVLSAQ